MLLVWHRHGVGSQGGGAIICWRLPAVERTIDEPDGVRASATLQRPIISLPTGRRGIGAPCASGE